MTIFCPFAQLTSLNSALWITRSSDGFLSEPSFMQNVYRLGKRRTAWLAIPVSIALGVAVALLWPQSPSSSVLIAKSDLPAGTVVSAADFEPMQAQLGQSASIYLSQLPGSGVLVSRVSKGQLIARSNIAPSPLATLLPTVLQFKDPLPSKLRVGSRVDVWATERNAEPAPIALECEVANVKAESSLGQRSTSVEVNCTSEYLPNLLRAKANGAVLAIVLLPTLLEQ